MTQTHIPDKLVASEMSMAFVYFIPRLLLLQAVHFLLLQLVQMLDGSMVHVFCRLEALALLSMFATALLYSFGYRLIQQRSAARFDAAAEALGRLMSASAAVVRVVLLLLLRIASAPDVPLLLPIRRLLYALLLPRIFSVSLRTTRA